VTGPAGCEAAGWEAAGWRPDRPYVLLSVATSIDGYTDDDSPDRLVLSDDADWDRVDELRAGADAILVGANTVRRDDPRLLVRSPARRRARVARGLRPHPTRVTMTARGGLDPAARLFTPDAETLVYAPAPAAGRLAARLGPAAEVIALGGDNGAGGPTEEAAMPGAVLADLFRRGVRRLMIEGGEAVHTAFLVADLVDEIQIVTAPFFVGAGGAARFVGAGRFPRGPARPVTLAEVRRIGDQVLARYLLGG
jgi:5-amino-6-(5-phosphoribosylamino)uracil reductase